MRRNKDKTELEIELRSIKRTFARFILATAKATDKDQLLHLIDSSMGGSPRDEYSLSDLFRELRKTELKGSRLEELERKFVADDLNDFELVQYRRTVRLEQLEKVLS